LVYWSGISIVIIEFCIVFFLFWRPTRMAAIYLGIFFQTLLMLTLDVPATFFFMFPAMLLLFINPNDILTWIQTRQRINQSSQRPILLYDGSCGFCKWSVRTLQKMDLFCVLEYKNFNEWIDRNEPLPAGLTNNDVLKRMYLIENNTDRYGGYIVFRRICWHMPMMFPLIPIIFFPGMGIIGPLLYDLVAKNRKCLVKPS